MLSLVSEFHSATGVPFSICRLSVREKKSQQDDANHKTNRDADLRPIPAHSSANSQMTLRVFSQSLALIDVFDRPFDFPLEGGTEVSVCRKPAFHAERFLVKGKRFVFVAISMMHHRHII